jgi:hypothetical protein
MYTPDNWVILKITHPDGILYRILAGWSGSYLDGDRWRMNSGITRFEEEENYYVFYGYSGSAYRCHKDSETLRMNCAYVLQALQKEYPNQVEQIWYEEFINEFEPRV